MRHNTESTRDRIKRNAYRREKCRTSEGRAEVQRATAWANALFANMERSMAFYREMTFIYPRGSRPKTRPPCRKAGCR